MDVERFLLIDEIADLVPPDRITAIGRIPEDARVFEGHFPGEPLFPGVLQAETMAQAAGLLMMREDRTVLPVLAGIEKARFRATLRPGDAVQVLARRTYAGDAFSVFACELTTGGRLAATAEIRLARMRGASEAVRRHVGALLARLGLATACRPEAAS